MVFLMTTCIESMDQLTATVSYSNELTSRVLSRLWTIFLLYLQVRVLIQIKSTPFLHVDHASG
jgi:hypothetical protein